MPHDVILVHGLWMPALAMLPLARRLAHAGFRCHRFDYSGRSHTLATCAARLRRFMRARAPQGAHFVAHSMGGLVTLRALHDDRDYAAGRVVLLGTPARGCVAGRQFATSTFGRWMIGESRPLWDACAASWQRAEPLGVIAGTRTLGPGALFARPGGVNDGVVRVDETVVEGMHARITLPVQHTQMLVSARVSDQVITFLRDGRFDGA